MIRHLRGRFRALLVALALVTVAAGCQWEALPEPVKAAITQAAHDKQQNEARWYAAAQQAENEARWYAAAAAAEQAAQPWGNCSGVQRSVEASNDCWRGLVDDYKDEWNVREALAVLYCESKGDRYADNPDSSAFGLMQILPGGSGDPVVNMRQAIAKWRDRGWQPWSSCPWRQYVR